MVVIKLPSLVNTYLERILTLSKHKGKVKFEKKELFLVTYDL